MVCVVGRLLGLVLPILVRHSKVAPGNVIAVVLAGLIMRFPAVVVPEEVVRRARVVEVVLEGRPGRPVGYRKTAGPNRYVIADCIAIMVRVLLTRVSVARMAERRAGNVGSISVAINVILESPGTNATWEERRLLVQVLVWVGNADRLII